MCTVDKCNSSPSLLRRTCSLHRNLLDLRPPINTNFSGNRLTDCDVSSDQLRHIHMSGFDFTMSHENVYDVCTSPVNSDEDENWNVTPQKQSRPNKPTPHLQHAAPYPTNRILEGILFKSYQCKDREDRCGSTQQRRFRDHMEQCDSSTPGSKCSASAGRQAHHEDSCPRWPWKDTEFCDVACGGRSVSFAAGHSLPVDTDSTLWPTEGDGSHCRAFCHKPSLEATEICGEKAPTVGTAQQKPPIWCLDCHENLVAIGCANGRLEFWEGTTGTFKVVDIVTLSWIGLKFTVLAPLLT
jgi:hypothetical protein